MHPTNSGQTAFRYPGSLSKDVVVCSMDFRARLFVDPPHDLARVPGLALSRHSALGWRVKAKATLGRTSGRILDFSFGARTENGHEMGLRLVSGADSSCVLHHFSILTCLKGSWGQVWPETDQN